MSERVLVVGLGRSGRSIAHLLRDHGREVVLTDAAMERADVPRGLSGFKWAGASPSDALIAGIDTLVLSPGVPVNAPLVRRAREAGKRISGELEEAWRISDVPVIAVTGTNGKSTTTMLISWLLERCGWSAPAGGNLGTPYSELARFKSDADFHVVEVSSFQAETLDSFRPAVGVFLNLAPDHLDRHGDMESYAGAKRRIFETQEKTDTLVLGAGQSVRETADGLSARVVSLGDADSMGAWVAGDEIWLRTQGSPPRVVAAVADVPLAGRHHLSNAVAALAAASCVDHQAPERLAIGAAEALRSFRGLLHRMEPVGSFKGIDCFDDSKATNVDAVVAGIRGLDQPVLLICGGSDDGQDFGPMVAVESVERVYGIGEAGARAAAAFGRRGRYVATMRAALEAALGDGRPGDAIVLSPASKSFDQYRDFAERGRHFKRLVAELGTSAHTSKPLETVHFVGVGGAGMSGLAAVLAHRGRFVTGSDIEDGALLPRLRAAGVMVHVGHHPDHVAGAGRVVVSSAIRGDNPEVVAAEALGIPTVRRAELLAELVAERTGIAITGSHGKTTTSALVAHGLRGLGRDPLALIGGDLVAHGANVLLGDGPHLVCEADESDGSFALLSPRIAAITNLDADHLDHYGSMDGTTSAFRDWITGLHDSTVFCVGSDDNELRQLVSGRRARTCGLASEADVRVQDLLAHTRGTRFRVQADGDEAVCDLPLLGVHNVANAAIAIGTLLEAGVTLAQAAAGLSSFGGVARRFEIKGEVGGVLIVDDYAHHPTEIAAVIASTRLHVGRRIRAVFQPHRYTRTRALEAEFAAALEAADDVIVTGIYGADERDPGAGWDHGIDGLLMRSGRTSARRIDDLSLIAPTLAAEAEEGDVVLFLSAGNLAEQVVPGLVAALGPETESLEA